MWKYIIFAILIYTVSLGSSMTLDLYFKMTSPAIYWGIGNLGGAGIIALIVIGMINESK